MRPLRGRVNRCSSAVSDAAVITVGDSVPTPTPIALMGLLALTDSGNAALGAGSSYLVQPARLELALLDPELRRDLRIVAAHLLDEALGVLAPDEHLELDAEREVGREGVIDDGVDDH